MGQLRFFNFSVEPVITVRVTVQERGCVIELLSCEVRSPSRAGPGRPHREQQQQQQQRPQQWLPPSGPAARW